MLVAKAGVNEAVTLEATSEESFDRLFDTDAKGVFFLVQQGMERLRDGGRIVTLSSGLTRFVYPQYAAYAITKAAIDQLTRSLAKTLGARGTTVNSVVPGAIDTDLNAGWLRDNPAAQDHLAGVAALGRVGRPDDVADVVAFLASDDSRWVTAQRIEVSGGAHL
ncbi:MAG: SDR family oxidoreductase [Pseudomonadota bacterium]